ncbi:MAG: response regulator, partial [Proteobacteria bacterium]|nr:response regulator [Pseudomonadota bacterium]
HMLQDISSSIMVMEDNGLYLRPIAGPHLPVDWLKRIDPLRVGKKAGSCGTSAFSGRRVIVENIETDPLWERGRGLALSFGLKACWSEPIKSEKDKILGTFAIYSYEPRSPSHAEIEVIESIANLAATIIQKNIAEKTLRESEEKYRLLFENANDAIFVAQDQLIKFPNPRTLELAGYSTEELAKIPFVDLVHPEDKALVVDRHIRRLSGEEDLPATYSFRVINKTGDEVLIELSAVTIIWEGRQATLNFLRDITQQKKIETQLQEAQRMEAIGTLAGGIAHDFNNIIGIILGYSELAVDDVPELNPARRKLEEIRKASLRAKDVVRQLLSFARKSEIKKKPTNLIPIVKESLNFLRSSIPRSIEIRQNIPEDVDSILADPTQMNQVLINLCTNANHAMPEGGILEVSLQNVELDGDMAVNYPDLKPGRYVNLTVSDTGQGINLELKDRIFDPYFTTKEIGKGTGMGLSVVHGIVLSHKGAIFVDSEIGHGTTFSLFFKVVKEEAVSELEVDEKLPEGNEKILLVDDEESIVHVGRLRLERLGYEVETIMNPVEALELFRASPDRFDLVITDMTMPQMNGDQLVKEVLKIHPDMPIILCTGFSEKIDAEKAKTIGVRKYIEKPINSSKFAKIVRKVLDEK